MSIKIAHEFSTKARTGDVIADENVDFTGLLLSPAVQSGLTSAGFCRPSPIQLKAIPLGRCGLDLIVQAKSGTGKTCVFAVIALEGILIESVATQVLVLAPTREIAIQIKEVLTTIGSDITGLTCHTFIGGIPLSEDKQKLQKCHIAVGTPGRVKQLIEEGVMSTSSIRMFILDEADKLMEDGFQESINWIYSSLPDNKQMLALSATYPECLANSLTCYMRNPTFVRLNSSDPALLGIRQYYKTLPSHPMVQKMFDIKADALIDILSSVSFHQCLVFSNYQLRAQSLSEVLTSKGWPATYTSGSQDQEHRQEALTKLRQFQCRVLVSTDLTSRGIDADKVDLVINLDLPRDHETYLHRVGRAGRFGSYGVAVNLVCTGAEVESMMRIERLCNTTIMSLPDPVPADLTVPVSLKYTNIDDLVTTERIINQPSLVKVDQIKNDTEDILAKFDKNPSLISGDCVTYESEMLKLLRDDIPASWMNIQREHLKIRLKDFGIFFQASNRNKKKSSSLDVHQHKKEVEPLPLKALENSKEYAEQENHSSEEKSDPKKRDSQNDNDEGKKEKNCDILIRYTSDELYSIRDMLSHAFMEDFAEKIPHYPTIFCICGPVQQGKWKTPSKQERAQQNVQQNNMLHCQHYKKNNQKQNAKENTCLNGHQNEQQSAQPNHGAKNKKPNKQNKDTQLNEQNTVANCKISGQQNAQNSSKIHSDDQLDISEYDQLSGLDKYQQSGKSNSKLSNKLDSRQNDVNEIQTSTPIANSTPEKDLTYNPTPKIIPFTVENPSINKKISDTGLAQVTVLAYNGNVGLDNKTDKKSRKAWNPQKNLNYNDRSFFDWSDSCPIRYDYHEASNSLDSYLKTYEKCPSSEEVMCKVLKSISEGAKSSDPPSKDKLAWNWDYYGKVYMNDRSYHDESDLGPIKYDFHVASSSLSSYLDTYKICPSTLEVMNKVELTLKVRTMRDLSESSLEEHKYQEYYEELFTKPSVEPVVPPNKKLEQIIASNDSMKNPQDGCSSLAQKTADDLDPLKHCDSSKAVTTKATDIQSDQALKLPMAKQTKLSEEPPRKSPEKTPYNLAENSVVPSRSELFQEFSSDLHTFDSKDKSCTSSALAQYHTKYGHNEVDILDSSGFKKSDSVSGKSEESNSTATEESDFSDSETSDSSDSDCSDIEESDTSDNDESDSCDSSDEESESPHNIHPQLAKTYEDWYKHWLTVATQQHHVQHQYMLYQNSQMYFYMQKAYYTQSSMLGLPKLPDDSANL